jgi:hypothetical protein
MSDHCGSTTEGGNAVCIPGECSCSEPNSNQPVILSVPTINNKEKNYVEENS